MANNNSRISEGLRERDAVGVKTSIQDMSTLIQAPAVPHLHPLTLLQYVR